MQKCVLQSIIKAFNCASDDVTRYHIGHVSITSKDKTHVVIEATDGHCLSQVTILDDLAGEILGKRYLIHRDQLPLLKLILKNNGRHNPTIAHSWSDGRLMIGNVELNKAELTVKTDAELNTKYPETAMLWPSKPVVKRIAFNPELLTSIHKALSDGTGTTRNVVIEIHDDDGCGPMTVKCGENKAILMPVRL